MDNWKTDYNREYMRAYREAHPEKIREQNRKAAAAYRARKKDTQHIQHPKRKTPVSELLECT